MARPRDRILQNLESIYREAYERAKAARDEPRMADLDAAYQREQLLLEVLLDIRDALAAVRPAGGGSGEARAEHATRVDPLAALDTIRRVTKLR